MESLAGTQTEKNLLKAFAGESQARNRYAYFSKVAKKEGYEQISELFMLTAIQEEQHAKIFFKFLEGNMVEITATYPAGKIGTTAENLKAATLGENEEWTTLYPRFSEIAKEEGFAKIASMFKLISKIEIEHEKRFLKLLKNIEENTVFEQPEETEWVCRKCGLVHKGKKALEICPACNHPKGYFERVARNY